MLNATFQIPIHECLWRVPKKRRKRELTRGERNCGFIEKYCIVPEGKLVGKKIKLADFQVYFILDVYDNPHGTSDAILSMARKNSKTATIACLVLVHLVGPEAVLNSEIVSGARSREQAAQVYRYASKMVDLNPKLRAIVRKVPSKKALIGLVCNVEYHALAAEAGTAHGGSPILAILDEVGQVRGPKDKFIEAIITSQGAYENPLLIIISTQAETDDDLLSIWIDDVLDKDGARKPGADPSIICHLYTTPMKDNMLSKESWAKSNPAMGLFRSIKDINKLAKKAERMPSLESAFRNLYLNQRVTVNDPFVSRLVWELNGDAPIEFLPMAPVQCGLDLSARTDLTAFVLIQKIEGIWMIRAYFWTPLEGLLERSRRDRTPYEQWVKEGFIRATPGATVDYEVVAKDIKGIIEGLNIESIAFDRWRMDVLKKEFERAGVLTQEDGTELPLVPFGQGYKSIAPALDAVEADLLNGDAAHGMNPVLTMCAANSVVVKDPAGNRKLDKVRSTGRIDGMIAYVMARGVADSEPIEEESVYENRGVVSIDVG